MKLYQKILLCLIGIGSLVALHEGLGYAQAKKEYFPYLQSHFIRLDTATPNWGCVFPEEFYNNDIYLIGERHGITYTYDALWTIFRQIHDHTHFRYYLLEAPLYWEIYLNRYLSIGDERYLMKPFNEAKGTYYGNQPFVDYYKKVYAYNKNLPDSEKIHFIAIDVEHQYRFTHELVKELLHRTAPSSSFTRLVDGKDPDSTGNYVDAYHAYQEAINKDSGSLQHILSIAAYDTLCYLIRNMNYKFLANADPKDLARDSLMYENFKWRTRGLDLKKDKVFGFFGKDHVYLDCDDQKHFFASFIAKQDYRISSMLMLYSDCRSSIPIHYLPKAIRFLWGKQAYFQTKWRSNDWPAEHIRYISLLKSAAPGKMSIFRLDAPGSPFFRVHVFVDDFKTARPTVNYAQYAILIRHSPAAPVLP